MAGEKRIRVCHLASGDLWAGAEVQIVSLLGALKGYPGLEISAVLLNRGRLAEELGVRGIPVTIYPESSLGLFKLLRAVTAHVKEHKHDILHSHRYKEHIIGAVAAKLSHNPVVVQTFHGLEEHLRGWTAVKMAAYTGMSILSGRMSGQGFIGVSREITDVLTRRYPAGDVRCIRNGVDLDRVKPSIDGPAMRAKLGIPGGAFVVGAVGRLAPIKGIEHLLRAFAILSKEKGSLLRKLVLVGDGPLRSSLAYLAQTHNIAPDTVFLGERTDVFDVMSMLDVLALPSIHEGIPMVLLEAMALGVPIVASRVGGIPEILEEDRDAILVPPQDPEALAHAIGRLSADPQLRERLRMSARERVVSEFSITRTAACTDGMYRDLTKEAAC